MLTAATFFIFLAGAARLVHSRFDAADPVEPCSMETCFDLQKCTASPKIYMYPLPDGQPVPTCDYSARNDHTYFQACLIYELISSGFQLTTDPDEACLLVPSLDANCAHNLCRETDFSNLQAAHHALPHWNEGRNHVVFNYNNDWPNPGFDLGKAVVVRVSWINETYRPHFDVHLPLTRPHMREPSAAVLQLGNLAAVAAADPEHLLEPVTKNRNLLLQFKGCVQRFNTPGMCEDRVNIFNTYFPPPTDQPDVVILAMCCGDHNSRLPTLKHCVGCNDNKKANGTSCTADWPDFPWEDGLMRSKFTFTPRGCGSLSYRMLEAIGAGSVPVLTGRGTIVPFAGEGQLGRLWAKCVIHVPMEELPDLISRLRSMNESEYHSRLIACAQIAALQSHTIRVLGEQAICMILSRVVDALRRQSTDGDQHQPAWLQGFGGPMLFSGTAALEQLQAAHYARALVRQCHRVGVHLKENTNVVS